MTNLFPLIRPALSGMDPERAHGLTIKALKLGLGPTWQPPQDPTLAQSLWGLSFRTPVGLAAGFDKDAEVPDKMAAMGFGFVEVGTVTPRSQAGNPKPRLFRLPRERAVINRMGFNNRGSEAMRDRLTGRNRPGVPLGINIGANKDSTDRVADYIVGARRLSRLADFLVINVSSPNTPGLRDLQGARQIYHILVEVRRACQEASCDGRLPPVLVKIAPDLSDEALADVVAGVQAGCADGMIVSNTTVGLREGLRGRHAAETGGLSGRPLFDLATERLAATYRLTGGKLPLIGVGGIDSADAAYLKIRNGASLVQLYSALVYHGPDLVRRITLGLGERLRADGFSHVRDAVGVDVSLPVPRTDAVPMAPEAVDEGDGPDVAEPDTTAVRHARAGSL